MQTSSSAEQLSKVQKVSQFFKILLQIGQAAIGIGVAFSLIAAFSVETFDVTPDGSVINIGTHEYSVSTNSNEAEQANPGKFVTNLKLWAHSSTPTPPRAAGDTHKVDATPLIRFLIAVTIVFSAAVSLNLFERLVRLFNAYAKGEIFERSTVKHIYHSGLAVAGYALIPTVNAFIGGILMLIANIAGGGLHIALNFTALPPALIVILISWIMDIGCQLREDSELTI